MKKYLFSLFGLLFCYNAFAAGIISVPSFSADSGQPHLEYFRSTVVGAINGGIQGSGTTGSTTNILSRSLGELDMANEINPRLRDSELLGITTDNTSVQATFVASGLTPATSANLTSNISTGTVYVNGYRVNKSATAETYQASMDTYVDLSQTGAFTLSPVANGGTPPAVAANSARLAKVVTSGTAITGVTDLSNRRIPGLATPTNYRQWFFVSRDSATTITVFPGTIEINGSMLSSSSVQTLTLTNAANWAGGTSLQATSTYGYVGLDASGNLRMHTTAPTNSNYGLTIAVGKLRYASWSSVVYRIIGWFYMNATGSGQLNTYEVGNINEGDTKNITSNASTTAVTINSTTYLNDTSGISHFYSSGGLLTANYFTGMGDSGAANVRNTISIDTAGAQSTERETLVRGTSTALTAMSTVYSLYASQGPHTIQGEALTDSGTVTINNRSLIARED